MSDEIEKLLEGDKKKETPALGEKTAEQIKEEEKAKAAQEHLNNIQKAIEEGNKELRKIRDAKKKGITTDELDEEDIPQIDFKDKSAKAWEKHISEKVNPLNEEMAKEKEEIRTFAIKEFLKDKPELAKDPEKLKRVIGTYEKIRVATERTVPGVLMDLKKAYSAEFADEILQNNENEVMERARAEVLFSAPAISNGSSSFRDEKEKTPHLSQDDAAVLAKWGMTPAQWVDMKKKQAKK